MALLISIPGRPATGKSYSLINLSAEDTIIVDADIKPFGPSVEFQKKFSEKKKNLFKTNELDRVKTIAQGVSEKMPHIKNLAIDTQTAIWEQYMHNLRKKSGFDKYKNVAEDIYDFFKFLGALREDLNVIIYSHTENYKVVLPDGTEGLGERIAVPGAKTSRDQTILKSLSFNLYSYVDIDEDGNRSHYFATQSNGLNDARSPEGIFDTVNIPNDIKAVIDTIRSKMED